MAPVMQNEGVAGATGTQTDTITVEIRNTTAPYAIVASTKTVLNTNGTASVAFAAGGTYYLAIKHRNGVQTWSATPITLSGAPITYDFSDFVNKAYGNNQVALVVDTLLFQMVQLLNLLLVEIANGTTNASSLTEFLRKWCNPRWCRIIMSSNYYLYHSCLT